MGAMGNPRRGTQHRINHAVIHQMWFQLCSYSVHYSIQKHWINGTMIWPTFGDEWLNSISDRCSHNLVCRFDLIWERLLILDLIKQRPVLVINIHFFCMCHFCLFVRRRIYPRTTVNIVELWCSYISCFCPDKLFPCIMCLLPKGKYKSINQYITVLLCNCTNCKCWCTAVKCSKEYVSNISRISCLVLANKANFTILVWTAFITEMEF